MTTKSKQEELDRRLHILACKLVGLDDEDHEDDELAKPIEKELKEIINQQVLSALEKVKSNKEIYVKHADMITELNEPPLVITTDYKYMVPLSAIEEIEKEYK